MLTYLKVALWLADCSPSLSHIPLLSVLSLVCLVVPFASCLRGAVPCVLALAVGWLRGFLCLPAAAAAGLRLGLLPLPCCPLCASSSTPVGIRECVRPLALPHGCCPCALCALGPWTSSPAVPPCPVVWSRYLTLSPWCGCGGLACGGRGFGVCPWLPRVGCLDPGHE